MPFFDDYTNAIESYPESYVQLEIVNITVPGSALNQGETGSFDVKVTNSGPLRMNDLTVRIRGLNGTLVADAGAAAPYVSEFVTSAGQFPQVPAHNSDGVTNIGGFRFKAPASAQPPQDLVEVTFEDWKPDFEHIHLSHTRAADAVKAVHNDRVRAA